MNDLDPPDPEAALGQYAAEFALADVPSTVADRARLILLDTLGVCIRGAETGYVSATLRQLETFGVAPSDSGSSTSLATCDRRSILVATLGNAAAGTTLELDEGNQRSGHMGIHVVPPALAVAESVDASGADLLEAIIVGYEVSARVGSLDRPMIDGLHPHGAWAPVGAAVAAGRLLALDASELAHAVRIAVNPFQVGHWAAATEGATVRDFYPGLAGVHGLHAVAFARGGVTGVGDAMRRCLFPYTAATDVTSDAIQETISTLGEAYYLESSYFKIHAACRYTHAPLEALSTLLETHDITPEDITRITVRTFEMGARLDDPHPANPLAAKFSTPFTLAARIVTGSTDVGAFDEARVNDDRIRNMASRVDVVADPRFETRAADGDWGAAIEVELDDGTVVETTVLNARGGPEQPFRREEILGKFERLVGDVEPRETVDHLRDRLLNIEAVGDLRGLLAPLR